MHVFLLFVLFFLSFSSHVHDRPFLEMDEVRWVLVKGRDSMFAWGVRGEMLPPATLSSKTAGMS